MDVSTFTLVPVALTMTAAHKHVPFFLVRGFGIHTVTMHLHLMVPQEGIMDRIKPAALFRLLAIDSETIFGGRSDVVCVYTPPRREGKSSKP